MPQTKTKTTTKKKTTTRKKSPGFSTSKGQYREIKGLESNKAKSDNGYARQSKINLLKVKNKIVASSSSKGTHTGATWSPDCTILEFDATSFLGQFKFSNIGKYKLIGPDGEEIPLSEEIKNTLTGSKLLQSNYTEDDLYAISVLESNGKYEVTIWHGGYEGCSEEEWMVYRTSTFSKSKLDEALKYLSDSED